jgi:hypothetical protein
MVVIKALTQGAQGNQHDQEGRKRNFLHDVGFKIYRFASTIVPKFVKNSVVCVELMARIPRLLEDFA